MDETVRLQTDGGVWEVGGADRRHGIWPEDVNCVWDEWGAKTARFTLKREAGAIYPDLAGFTPCIIEKGSGVWEGYVDQTPVADVNSLAVEAIGWQDYADDDVLRKMYVCARLADWRDIRSYPAANLNQHKQNGDITVGGVIRLAFRSGQPLGANDAIAVVFDAGEGNLIKAVSVNMSYDIGFDFIDGRLYVIGSDTPYWSGAGRVDLIGGVPVPSGGYTASGPGRRYMTIMAYVPTGGGTPGVDCTMTVNSARMYAESAYMDGSGNSALKASTALKDLLPRLCPQWNQDLTGISNTLLNLPDFAPTEERSFREYVNVLNSLHGYVAKLERGRRFVFRPQPLVPKLTAAPGLGVEFRDASKNATRDLYNRAIGLGTGPDGEPIRVVRTAAQQSGVPTLLDRRGRVRTKQVSMPTQAMDTAVLTQFADVWLQTHMFTPLRGDVTVTGAGFREYTTGRPIDPFELGEYTTELVQLAGEIDPDKGYLGRAAKVASVSYDGNAESASVSLDANREDFEKVVARYDVISSGGGPG